MKIGPERLTYKKVVIYTVINQTHVSVLLLTKKEFSEKKNADSTRKDTNYICNICERDPGLYLDRE